MIDSWSAQCTRSRYSRHVFVITWWRMLNIVCVQKPAHLLNPLEQGNLLVFWALEIRNCFMVLCAGVMTIPPGILLFFDDHRGHKCEIKLIVIRAPITYFTFKLPTSIPSAFSNSLFIKIRCGGILAGMNKRHAKLLCRCVAQKTCSCVTPVITTPWHLSEDSTTI